MAGSDGAGGEVKGKEGREEKACGEGVVEEVMKSCSSARRGNLAARARK